MNRAVIYLDTKGKEHEALVFAVNPLNEGYVSLVYVDESRPDADNVVKLFDVRHMATIEETNPALPTYHLNCWKDPYEDHLALPADHPAFDHPHLPTTDADGKVIPVDRPEYDAQVASYQAYQAQSQADGHVEEPEVQESAGGAGVVSPALGAGSGPVLVPPALPTAADLDAVAAEQKAAEATSGAPEAATGEASSQS